MLADIHLQHFRSYKDESFELDPGVNIIVGPNASGKTNLLEAILVIARGNSYRGLDKELIQFKKPWTKIEAHTEASGSRVVQIEIKDGYTQKLFKLDNQPLKRLSLNRTLPVVLFEPNHLEILNGAPEARRQFLDELLDQVEAGYANLRRQYKRTLSQRNALLKKGQRLASEQMFAWDVRLSELGAQLAANRQKLVSSMNTQASELYGQLSKSKSQVRLEYQTTASLDRYASDLLKKLETHRDKDFERGFTSYGPHREDLAIYIDGHPTQESASRGERRTMLLVLKILEAKLLEEYREIRPLLLLDDVFSELDGARRQALTNFLKPYQSFITTTDADVVVQHFTENTHIIPLGKLVANHH